jgi:hypothetical protein
MNRYAVRTIAKPDYGDKQSEAGNVGWRWRWRWYRAAAGFVSFFNF